MKIKITQREIRDGANGQYLYVKGVKPDGKDAGKAIFDKLKEKWELCQVGVAVDLKLDKEDNWNCYDILLDGDALPPPVKPPIVESALPPKHEAESAPKTATKDEIIARHVWWKQLGDDLRSGHIDKTTETGKALRKAYFAEMFSVLDIKIEKE